MRARSARSRNAARSFLHAQLCDALAQPGCAICRMARQQEQQSLWFFLFEGVMSPESRGQVLRAGGYCRWHSYLLLDVEQRGWSGVHLGSVVLHESLFAQLLDQLARDLARPRPRRVDQLSGQAAPAPLLTLLNHRTAAPTWRKMFPSLAMDVPCPACASSAMVEHSLLTTLMEGLDDPLMAANLAASAGLCRPHLEVLAHLTSQTRPERERQQIAARLSTLLLQALDAHQEVPAAPSDQSDAISPLLLAHAGYRGVIRYRWHDHQAPIQTPDGPMGARLGPLCPDCVAETTAAATAVSGFLRRLQHVRQASGPIPNDQRPADPDASTSVHHASVTALLADLCAPHWEQILWHAQRRSTRWLLEPLWTVSIAARQDAVQGVARGSRPQSPTGATCPVCAAIGAGSGTPDAHKGAATRCLPHVRRQLANAQTTEMLAIAEQARATARAILADLREYARKCDYRYRDEPPGPEQDAWWRAVAFLVGELNRETHSASAHAE
jgi:hypothetical protein